MGGGGMSWVAACGSPGGKCLNGEGDWIGEGEWLGLALRELRSIVDGTLDAADIADDANPATGNGPCPPGARGVWGACILGECPRGCNPRC